MAFPFFQVVYTVPAKAVQPIQMAAALAAIPLPISTLEEIGVYVTTDATTIGGGNAIRTITGRVTSPTPASASPVLNPGDSGSPIIRADVTTHGAGYVRPPLFLPFDPGSETLAQFMGRVSPPALGGKGAHFQSYLGIRSQGEVGTAVHLLAGGANYSNQTTAALIGGMPPGLLTETQARPQDFVSGTGTGTRSSDPLASGNLNTLGVVSAIVVLKQGKNYGPNTKLVFLGDPSTDRPARGFPIVVGGKIVSVVVTDSGSGYIKVPQVAFFDPSGTGIGAEAIVNMQHGNPASLTVSVDGGGHITAITVTIGQGGDGYVSVPNVVIFDPTGAGSGASATVGPVIGGSPSLLGVSRIDVMNRGKGYVAPVLSERSMFQGAYLVAEVEGDTTDYLRAFQNLCKTQIENALSAEVTETVS